MRSEEGERELRPVGLSGDRQHGVLALLSAATMIGSVGLAAGGTAGALLGSELAGTGAAGLPPGLLVIGSAIGALLISWQAGRGHRGRGLMLGYLLGVAGAAVVIMAAAERNMPLLLVGSTVLGVANSAIFLTRYAAMEAGDESTRGRALGRIFFATAIGAVLSPTLLGPSGALAEAIGLPALTGLYLIAIVAFGISALLFAVALNPRVPWFGKSAVVLSRNHAGRPPGITALVGALRGPRARSAFIALITTNFIMVGLMAIAPVDMMGHEQGLEMIGAIIALHVAGMFGPSPITGYLVDRFGPVAIVVLGHALLFISGLAGALVHDHSVLMMTGHLVILGVGWNCGVIGGSTLLAGSVPDEMRPHTEGIGEVVMGLSAAVAAPAAAVIAAFRDYQSCSVLVCVVAVSALIFVHRSRQRVEVRV